ncbi:MAG: NAD-dependent epimerase/dehydratase family protein [Thermoplasmatota archaeon]
MVDLDVDRMPSVMVTGGAGFIGSSLTEHLLHKGYHAIVLDNREDPKNSPEVLERIDYYNGDIRDKRLLNDILREHDVEGIVHLAAVSRVVIGEESPEICIDTNLNGTRILLEAIRESGGRPWFIYGSSREVYGEPANLPVKESDPKAPINTYGRTKLGSEKLLEEHARTKDLKACTLRFSNVYGNENDIQDRVIPRFIIAGLRNERMEIHGGRQIFDFTHIDDTVNGIGKCVEHLEKRCNGHPGHYYDDFHVLIGKGVTLQELANIISRHLRKDIDIHYTKPRTYDVERFIGDPTKSREVLGFSANIGIEEGIRSTIERFREHLPRESK